MSQERPVVIVTGSSGFIGRAVIGKLALGFTLVGFDRETPPHPPADAECVCIDLTDESSVAAALKRLRTAYGADIASVIHLAAYFDLTGEPNPKYEQVTVRGTERLLRGLQGFRVEQFVFASTMLVHAPSKPGERIDEDQLGASVCLPELRDALDLAQHPKLGVALRMALLARRDVLVDHRVQRLRLERQALVIVCLEGVVDLPRLRNGIVELPRSKASPNVILRQ